MQCTRLRSRRLAVRTTSRKAAADWRPIAEAKGGRKTYEIAVFEKAVTARFLRIRFPSVTPEHPAAMSEVRVMAFPAN